MIKLEFIVSVCYLNSLDNKKCLFLLRLKLSIEIG